MDPPSTDDIGSRSAHPGIDRAERDGESEFASGAIEGSLGCDEPTNERSFVSSL
jgi:hypothetical protein